MASDTKAMACGRVYASTQGTDIPPHWISALSGSDQKAARSAALEFQQAAKKDSSLTKKAVDLLLEPARFPNHRDFLLSTLFYAPDKNFVFEQAMRLVEQQVHREIDPSILVSISRTLEQFWQYPKLSDEAMRGRLRVLERYRELELAADAAGKDRLNSIYFSAFAQPKSQEEQRLLAEGLAAARAGSELKTSELSFQVSGKTETLPVTEQKELERRVEFPSGKFDAKILRPTGYSSKSYVAEVPIADSEELVRALLDRHYSLRDYDDKFVFRPLGSELDHYHSGIVEIHERVGAKSDKFTKSLDNLMNVNRREGDRDSRKYIVTHQKEVADYFDTPDDLLRNRDLALRIKEWRPIGETMDPNAPPARAIFLKRTLPSPKGEEPLFTDRQEIMVKLPPGSSEDYTRSAIRALLEKNGVPANEAARVAPKVRIENQRHGFDLMWKEDVKIGYVVVDSYKPLPIAPGVKPEDYLHSSQWEVEILPQWTKLIEAERPALTEFLKKMEGYVDGQVDTRPKYMHPPRKAP